MEIIISILDKIFPTIIGGVITFFIAIYNYNKNRPLDKLETAYNRIYYPIYNLINDNNKEDINLIIEKSKFYLDKYKKYADRSTLKAFNELYQNKTDNFDKSAYQNFINKIYNKNSYLRIRLGYLEPNIIQMYPYLPKSDRSSIRMFMEFCILYILICLYNIFNNHIQKYILSFIVIIILIMIFEAIVRFINNIIKKTRITKKQPLPKIQQKDQNH